MSKTQIQQFVQQMSVIKFCTKSIFQIFCIYTTKSNVTGRH